FSELLGSDINNDGNNRTDRSPTVGRNTLRVGKIKTVDLRVTKNFNLYEDKVRVQLIGELFNAFNRTNVVSFQSNRYRVTGLNTTAATLVPRTDFLDPRGVPADGQRIGQLAIKLIF
ncbi:MAG: hypothetical protein ABIU20_08950, partial [Blastocatellia bacterium]